MKLSCENVFVMPNPSQCAYTVLYCIQEVIKEVSRALFYWLHYGYLSRAKCNLRRLSCENGTVFPISYCPRSSSATNEVEGTALLTFASYLPIDVKRSLPSVAHAITVDSSSSAATTDSPLVMPQITLIFLVRDLGSTAATPDGAIYWTYQVLDSIGHSPVEPLVRCCENG